MKSILKGMAIILSLAFIAVIAGCSTTAPESNNSSTNSKAEEAAMDKPAVYSVPEGDTKNDAYTVQVWTEKNHEKQNVDCFSAKVGTKSNGLISVSYETMSFCMLDFDYSSPVYISVTPKESKASVAVLPASSLAEHEYTDGTAVIKITKPTNLSVEFDGDIYHNLFIFAGTYDNEKPDEGSRGVIYYGPGTHDVGEIVLYSNQTLYIDGGAVVYGYIKANEARNIKILGSGILDGSKVDHEYKGNRRKMLDLISCEGVVIDGITLRDASTWGVSLTYCKDAVMTNVKQISYNFNSDGFDIMACENVVIDGAFARNYDDNVSIKANGSKDSKNITVQNSAFWADCAHNMLVGPEAKAAEYENVFSDITFKNIDILESKEASEFYRGVMAMTCTDNSVFENITWEDIRIERMTNSRIINFRYSTDYGTYVGKAIRNITIKNVTCKVQPTTKDAILGESGTPIENVTIENLVIAGKRITHSENNFGAGMLKYVNGLIIDGDEKSY